MKKQKTALARGLTGKGATSESLPPAGSLPEFLTFCEMPEEEALRVFSGPYAFQRHLRTAFVAIAAARASCGAAAAWLGRARDAIGALRDLDRRPTPVEDALFAARDQFRAAARACRRAASLIYEARRLAPRRRKLRAVT
jgi:hypothetical protein